MIIHKKIQNCTTENLDNAYKEIYKRFIIPFYIPILILNLNMFNNLTPKKIINYSRYRLIDVFNWFGDNYFF